MSQNRTTTYPCVISRRYFYAVWLFFNVVFIIARPFVFPEQPVSFHVFIALGTFVISAFNWEMVVWMSAWLQKRFPTDGKLTTLIVIQVLLSYLIGFIPFTLLNWACMELYPFDIEFETAVIAQILFFLSMVLYNLLYFGSLFFFRWKDNLLRAERIQREQAQVRYDVLRNQLNPHFLFNALTSLNSLIFDNQQLASDFLQQLSKVYRYTLQNKDKDTVSLQTEIEFVKNYIFLIKTRFAEAVHIELEIAQEAVEKGIVPVTLQVLLENALKHNVINSKNPLYIRIHANEYSITVENSLHKKQQVESSNRQGLDNLRSLYQYLADEPVEITETATTFSVKLPLLL